MEFKEYLAGHRDEMTEMLRIVVEHETPSHEKLALDSFASYLSDMFRGLGCHVELIEQAEAGNHLRASWGNGQEQVLVLCHMDTVWPLGETQKRPFRIENGKATGPGVYDMKGGLVQAFFALKAIIDLGIKVPRRIVFLCNSDEEIGSGSSRALIEEEAKRSAFVLVPEPTFGPDGAVKLARKGLGMFDVTVTGRAAHAGQDHAKGINAVEELAHQILKLQAMTNYASGTTISVGETHGGSGYNVVPSLATTKVDLRASTEAELSAAQAKIQNLVPVLTGTTITVTGTINRPPLEPTPANAVLYQKAQRFARELGFDLPGVHVGGVSDGNFTSAVGVATLDGIGAVGDGPHAIHEYLVLDSMVPRAALIAKLLSE